jgi:hypothetical protein
MSPNPVRAKILGTGRYLPSRVVTNDEIALRAGTTDAWLREHVGVVRRRVAAEGETTSDMATLAARSGARGGAQDACGSRSHHRRDRERRQPHAGDCDHGPAEARG